MGVWARVHAASAVALLPALALAPAVGAGLLAAWLALARPRRPAASRDAAIVLALVVAVVALRHGGPWATLLTTVSVGAVVAAAIVRLDATVTRAAAAAAGVGAALVSIGVAAAALAEALATGFAQIATASHHPNATAALALTLSAGSALAWRGGWPARGLGALGVAAAVVLLLLTGSRGGLVGLALALAVLLVLALARLLARAGRAAGGRTLAAMATLGLLVGLQTVLVAPGLAAWWAPAPAANGAYALDPTTGADPAAGAESTVPLLERLSALRDPLAASGGRLAAWKLAREMIGHRPTLGYGFDAIERVYAPGAARELANPLAHPHHGVLTLLLQGGSLFAVAVLVLLGGLAWRLLRAAVLGDVVAGIAAAALVALMGMELLDAVLRMGAAIGALLVVLAMATAASSEG